MDKWTILDENHGVTRLEKSQFFVTFSTYCFYSLEKRFFVLEYRKTHFSWLYCLENKKKTPL